MSDIKQQITEASGVHKAWYDERPKTPEELAAFVTRLLGDYAHDYGTICHAVAAAALAAARTVDADPRSGGITGFQGGCVMWEFVRHWLSVDGPMRLLRYENMLFPQYADDFTKTMKLETFRWLQEEAKKRLAQGAAHPDVVAHWQRIVDGEVPFGFMVEG